MKISKHDIRRGIFLTLFVLIALGAFYRLLGSNQSLVSTRQNAAATIADVSNVVIHGTTYSVELAVNEAERERGLGGRESLAPNTGMLFIFDKPDQYGFWMKDTLVPLDMIWISEDKHIVYIEKNVQPSTYPTIFSPDEDALYVLEVPAGDTDKNLFQVGDQVSISSAKLH